MDLEKLNKSYADLLNDINFDYLELESVKPNLFAILGAVHNELRHSNMLGWLMDTNAAHGVRESFLKRFLREVCQDERSSISQLEVEKLDFENVEVRREWNNIDLLIIFKTHVLVIENKIWSKETGNQLVRYKSIAEENFPDRTKIYVFLTPEGYEPQHEKDTYVPLSYQTVIEALHRIMEIRAEDLTQRTTLLIEDYLHILRRNIMNDDKAVKLAQEIYFNHKELFDFVYEHKPDLSEDLKVPFLNWIKEKKWVIGSNNKGYARFTSPEIHEILQPYKKGGWPDNEVMLFEIDYWWSSGYNDTRIFLKLVISPGDNDELKTVLREIIENIEGCGKSGGKKWLTYFKKKCKYPWDEMEEDPENIINYIAKMEEHICDTVEKVTTAIVENKDRLLEAQK